MKNNLILFSIYLSKKMNTDYNNINNKWLAEDKIVENIGFASSFSLLNLSLTQISNLLITLVLSEIELDSKNIHISNTEALQFKIEDVIKTLLNNKNIIYEQLLQKAEKDIRYYISKLMEYRNQIESSKTQIKDLLNQVEEYKKIKKRFDLIISTDIPTENEETINEIQELKEENMKLKTRIKELEIKMKDAPGHYYLNTNENFTPNYSLFNHHQRISSISSCSGNQSPLITELANSIRNNRSKTTKNTLKNISYQWRPILDSLISPKSSSKDNQSKCNNNLNSKSNDMPKNKFTFYKRYKQNIHQNNNINNNTITADTNKNSNNKNNKVFLKKKEHLFVKEFLSILKRHKGNKFTNSINNNQNINITQNNSNYNNTNSTTNSTNVIKSNRHQKNSSQGKLNTQVDKHRYKYLHQIQQQPIRNYYNNFIIYRNKNEVVKAKSKHNSYQSGGLVHHNFNINKSNNNNNNHISYKSKQSVNNTIITSTTRNNSNKQATRKQKILKKNIAVVMGLKYSNNNNNN